MRVDGAGSAAKAPPPPRPPAKRSAPPVERPAPARVARQQAPQQRRSSGQHQAVRALVKRLASSSDAPLRTTPSDTLRENLREYLQTPQPSPAEHVHAASPAPDASSPRVGPSEFYRVNPLPPPKPLTTKQQHARNRGQGGRWEFGTVNPFKDTTKNDPIADSNFEFLTPRERRRILSRT